VKDIQKKFLPHPFTPFLPALGMAERMIRKRARMTVNLLRILGKPSLS